MKKFIFPAAIVCTLLFACKKSASDTGGQSNGTGATVTFTNNQLYPQRLILTGTGAADTLFPFPNKVLDIDVAAKSSVTRTDIPEGTRKLYTAIVCTAGQPVNAACTTIVYRKAVYVKGSSYTEIF